MGLPGRGLRRAGAARCGARAPGRVQGGRGCAQAGAARSSISEALDTPKAVRASSSARREASLAGCREGSGPEFLAEQRACRNSERQRGCFSRSFLPSSPGRLRPFFTCATDRPGEDAQAFWPKMRIFAGGVRMLRGLSLLQPHSRARPLAPEGASSVALLSPQRSCRLSFWRMSALPPPLPPAARRGGARGDRRLERRERALCCDAGLHELTGVLMRGARNCHSAASQVCTYKPTRKHVKPRTLVAHTHGHALLVLKCVARAETPPSQCAESAGVPERGEGWASGVVHTTPRSLPPGIAHAYM